VITLRRASERRHERRRKHDVWHLFGADARPTEPADGFGDLEGLDEGHLQPGAVMLHRTRHDAEIITYVREGSVACIDSREGSSLIQAGEFQQRTIRRGTRHSECNTSRVDVAQTFQIRLHAEATSAKPKQEQKRFSSADRRGVLCVVASPDARSGSLRVCQDVVMHSAMLDPGQHVVHELSQGRGAWLHLIQGEASLGDLVLRTGDGVAVTADRAVSITAREVTEILLFDLKQPGSLGWGDAA